jgi:hypothetical protein
LRTQLDAPLTNQFALKRFDREPQAAAAFASPNVVSVFDYGHLGSEISYFGKGVSRRGELGVPHCSNRARFRSNLSVIDLISRERSSGL